MEQNLDGIFGYFFRQGIAFCYALFFSLYVPVFGYSDRQNYLYIAEYPLNILLGYLENYGLYFAFFNEPIWYLINFILSNFLSPEFVVRVIVFISSFTFAYYLLTRQKRYFWLLIITLLSPQFTKHYLEHLRQGLAISVFLLGWNPLGFKQSKLLMIVSCFIHTTFMFIVPVYFLYQRLSSSRVSVGVSIGLSLLIFILPMLALNYLTSVLPFRQIAEYQSFESGGSGFGLLFYLSIAIVLMKKSSKFIANNISVFLVLFYCIAYFYSPVAARILESGLVFIVIAALQLPASKQMIIGSLFMVSSAYHYV